MAAQQKQDDDKLGTSVTYTDPNQTKMPIRMGEITFIPGESTDLAQFLTEDQAKAMARRLANNAAFKVEGGPDHTKLLEARQKHEEEATKKQQEISERQQKDAARQQSQPPPDWKGPDQPSLEHQAAERRRVK
jgi:hypothetical protein